MSVCPPTPLRPLLSPSKGTGRVRGFFLHVRWQFGSPFLQNLPGGCTQPGAASQLITVPGLAMGVRAWGEGSSPRDRTGERWTPAHEHDCCVVLFTVITRVRVPESLFHVSAPLQGFARWLSVASFVLFPDSAHLGLIFAMRNSQRAAALPWVVAPFGGRNAGWSEGWGRGL